MNNLIIYINSRLHKCLVRIYLAYLFIVIIFSLNFFGYIQCFTNKSNSMSPSINTGSIIVVKKSNTYQIGEAISYYAKIDEEESIITHRITGIGGNVYTTKGDANEVADREIVLPRLVIGKVVLIIPYLGYLITFAKSLLGMQLSIIAPALIIICLELIKISKLLNSE